MGLAQDASCRRYMAPQTTFIHLAWACPLIRNSWQNVPHALENRIPYTPLTCLLGYVKDTPDTLRQTALLLFLVKRRVAIHWVC